MRDFDYTSKVLVHRGCATVASKPRDSISRTSYMLTSELRQSRVVAFLGKNVRQDGILRSLFDTIRFDARDSVQIFNEVSCSVYWTATLWLGLLRIAALGLGCSVCFLTDC